MKARKKTIETLRRHIRASEQDALKAQMKGAGLEDDDVRVAGRAARHDEGGGGASTMRRNIPKDYDYDPAAMKPLAQMLWALSIGLGHTMTAHRQFTKLKSATISPDGLLGGRGYVMSVKEIRQTLHNACEAISSVSDTIHDELHGPHWRSRLAELEGRDVESVERLVGEAERVLENPEEEAFVQDGISKAESQGEQAELEQDEVGDPESDERFAKPKPPPEFSGGDEDDEEDDDDDDDDEGSDEGDKDGSEIPDGKDLVDSKAPLVKTASHASDLFRRIADRFADSSLPVETVPGGPRVQHLDRGDIDQDGPFGSYNSDEPQSTADGWSRTDGAGEHDSYDAAGYWDDEIPGKTAESLTPGRYTDPTPTEGWDFGIGYGNGDDAHGQGAGGYGTQNSDGKGFYSPSSKLPSDPAGKTKDDTSDSGPAIEAQMGVGNRNAQARLPNDGEPGVARSDYYRGDKGSNLVNADDVFGDSELPSEADSPYDYSIDAQPGTGYRSERSQPYVKWDHTTRNMRRDDLFQRDDEGPYVKQGEG